MCCNEGCSQKKHVSSDKLLQCSACKMVGYCSKKCQKEDWKARHKWQCKDLRAVRLAKSPHEGHHLGADCHCARGMRYMAKTRWTKAIKEFRSALSLDPQNAEARNGLDQALMAESLSTGVWRETTVSPCPRYKRRQIASCRRAVTRKPKNGRAHFELGKALESAGDTAGAIASYRRAIECDPNNPAGHGGLGHALHSTGDIAGAIASWRRSLECDPINYGGHHQLGVTLHDTGDLAGAIAAHRQALFCNPRYVPAHLGVAVCLRDKGDITAAIASCRRALSYDRNHVQANQLLAQLHQMGV